MKTETKCPYCMSENVVKRGFSATENRGKQQRYLYKDCKKTFIIDTGFYKMKNSEESIAMSIDMYLSNLSSRKMRNQLMRHFRHKISHVSILDWVRKYIMKVHKYISGLKPELSGRMYADETNVDCENRKDVFWCAVDWDTRFINATLYSPVHQNLADATQFMEKIAKSKIPQYIQTDGLPFYNRAFTRTFYCKRDNMEVQHRVNNHSKTGKHNVRIETVFSKIKDRVYDFRGFKARWSAPILMAGIILQHNFKEAHTTTGKIPCELAGLKLEAGINRWLGMIRLASIH
ncbi:MAG: DDE-type integrase/transposase/recombinase [Nanoarchaeota archaeon]